MAKTALAKEPKKSKVDPKAAKAQARQQYLDTVRNLGNLTVGSREYNAAIKLINKTGKQLGYNTNRIDAAINKYKQQGTPGSQPGSPEEAFRRMSPEQQQKELMSDYGTAVNQLYGRYEQTSPEQYMKNYEIGFQQEREKAYSDIVNQFERSNEEQFAREDQQFQQRMLSQGIDPNSGYYQSQYKALKDAQNNQRLNAQFQASQQAYGVAKQAFEQGTMQYGLPAQLSQYYLQPGMLQYKTEQERLLEQERIAAGLQQARISGGAATGAARIQAETARDIAAMEQMGGYNQPKRPSTWSSVASGFGTGAGAAAANWAIK